MASGRALRMVLQVDAAGSAAMPAVLLGSVPLMIALDDHAGLIGMLILGYMVVLGLLGVAMAALTGRAVSRGDTEFPEATWFFTRT